MNADEIVAVLKALGCRGIKVRPKWVTATCCFETKRHEGGFDGTPSFGVKVSPNDLSFFRCQGCNIKGPMFGGDNDLLWQLRTVTRKWYPELVVPLQMSNVPSIERIQARGEKAVFFSGPREVAGIEVSPRIASQVDLFAEIESTQGIAEADFQPMVGLPSLALDYLHGSDRKLSDATIAHFGYGFVNVAKRIAVPQRDCKGRLVNISGRGIYSYMKPKWLHSEGFRKELYLYNEDKLDLAHRTGLLVEGMFDVAGIRQNGYVNCLGLLGAYISDFQMEKVVRWFDEVIIIRDGDQAGKQGAAATAKKLSARMRYGARVVDPPDGLDPDQLSVEFLARHLGPPQVAPLRDH